jgi:hypothetical protein
VEAAVVAEEAIGADLSMSGMAVGHLLGRLAADLVVREVDQRVVREVEVEVAVAVEVGPARGRAPVVVDDSPTRR